MIRLPSLWQNILLFGALLLIAEAREAKHFHPEDMQPGVGVMPVAKRQDIPTGTCEPAKSNINETAIYLDACGLTQPDDQAICYQQLAASVNASARATCSYYYTQYNDCLKWGSNNISSCDEALAGYQNCANDTLQAYAICGYYYHLSLTISTCADVLLQIHPLVLNATSIPTIPISPNITLSGPIPPATATPPIIPNPFNNLLAQNRPVGANPGVTDNAQNTATPTLPSPTPAPPDTAKTSAPPPGTPIPTSEYAASVPTENSAPPHSAPTPAPEYAVPAPENPIPSQYQTPTPASSDTAAAGSNAPAAAFAPQETTVAANAVQSTSGVVTVTDMHENCPGKRKRSVLLG